MSDDPDAWTPEFPGQRPPFADGHELSMVDGHRSERKVGPLAEQIAAELLAAPDTPAHLREPVFAASVQAWAHAEATCSLMRAWLADRDLMAGLTSATTTEEEETQSGKTITRKGKSRSVPSVLEILRKYEAHAANMRSKLGLDPASAARVGRDLALARHMNASTTALDDALAEAERKRELGTGDAGA